MTLLLHYRLCGSLLIVLLLGIPTGCIDDQMPSSETQTDDAPPQTAGTSVGEDQPESALVPETVDQVQGLSADAMVVDLFTANRIDESLKNLCWQFGVESHYCGSLSSGAGEMRLLDSSASYTSWQVIDDTAGIVVFALSVSPNKSQHTIGETSVNNRRFYLQLGYAMDDVKLDDPLDQLAGESIRTFVSLLRPASASTVNGANDAAPD